MTTQSKPSDFIFSYNPAVSNWPPEGLKATVDRWRTEQSAEED